MINTESGDRRSVKSILPIILLALSTVALCLYLERTVLGGVPHGWDALSYHFQARLFAQGRLSSPATPLADSFEMMHVVERADGSRYSKYPPGWPAMLALAVLVGYPALANALLAGGVVVLIWVIGRRLLDPETALLAAALALLSPFFVFMGASHTSHMVTAFLLMVVLWTLLRAGDADGRGAEVLWALGAGTAAGLAFLARPYSAVLGTLGVTLVAVVAARRPLGRWVSPLAAAAAAGLAVGSLFLAYNLATTGDPFLTGYRVLRPGHDFLGFDGPIRPSLWANVRYNGPYTLENLNRETWGWPGPDLALVFAGLLLARSRRVVWTLAAAAALFVVGQCAYFWSDLYFGPRMVFEAFPLLALGSAAGITSAVRRVSRASAGRWPGRLAVAATAAFLLAGAWRLYPELAAYYASDYCGQSPRLVREIRARSLASAVVFVSAPSEVEYGSVFPLNSLEVTAADVVYARFDPGRLEAVAAAYPRDEYWLLEIETSLVPGQRNLYPDRYRLDAVEWRRLTVGPDGRLVSEAG